MTMDVDSAVLRDMNCSAMRALLDYQPDEPSRLTRFLWRCAGADERLLRLCTHSEHVTYAGLGAFVLVTGLLAMLTGGFALWTIFKPTDGSSPVIAAVATFAFAAFWGAMIFNLDRYIVASSGKGDGKETISLQELKNAAPRLVLAVIIGLVMSTPLELRIFKREIDVELAKRRIEKLAELEQRDSVQFAARSMAIDSTLRAMQADMQRAHAESQVAWQEMRDEGDGVAGTGRAGAGPRYENKRRRYEEVKATEAALAARYQPRMDSLQAQRDGMRQELERHEHENEKVTAQMGGLIDQIHIAHEKGGVITWVIRLLIMVLEIIPVLSKLMYRTGPYDVMQEHLRVLIPARLGAATESHDLVVNGQLVTRTTEVFPMAHVVYTQAANQLSKLLASAALPSQIIVSDSIEAEARSEVAAESPDAEGEQIGDVTEPEPVPA